jgi:cation diffusion facilitator family transporter
MSAAPAIVAALAANLGIAVTKFAAFALTGSSSMLAESIHSVADTGNQGLLFLGGKRSRRRPTEEHPFGFGTERYFWAFIVALVLFTLGSMFALFEGVEKLIDPHELESPIWAFAVLGVAMVLEGWSAHRRRRGDPSRAVARGGNSSAPPRVPSYPSCCSRTPAPSSACSSR